MGWFTLLLLVYCAAEILLVVAAMAWYAWDRGEAPRAIVAMRCVRCGLKFGADLEAMPPGPEICEDCSLVLDASRQSLVD